MSSYFSQIIIIFFFLPLSLLSSIASWRRQFILRIWPIQLAFPGRILFRSVLFSPIGLRSRTCSLLSYSDHFIFHILLQHYISKLSKYFRSNFLSIQFSEPHKAILLTKHLTTFFLSSMFSFLVKSDIFMLNAYLVMTVTFYKQSINVFKLSAPKVLFSFSILSCRSIPCC